MKLLLRTLTILFTIVLLYSCKNEEKNSDTLEESSEKVEKKVRKNKSMQNFEENNQESIDGQNDKFTKYLNSEMKSFKVLPDALWLQPEFVVDINNTEGIEEKISYDKNVFIEGDFNHDGFTDRAAFMQDNESKVYLMSFHQTEEGFDRYILNEEEKISECCLARGISITPPGIYFEKNTEKEKIIKSDGIIYTFYANSKYIYHFDGSGYKKFQIAE